MKVKVKLFATLRKERFDENEFEFNISINIELLLNMLKIKKDEVAIVFINGKHADLSTPLKESDEVAFFPPIGGG